jgi:hypothetical protein
MRMPTRDDLLRDETFKDEGLETDVRVYYTLTDKKNVQAHRTAKAISLLVATLERKGLLTNAEIDELLLEIALL